MKLFNEMNELMRQRGNSIDEIDGGGCVSVINQTRDLLTLLVTLHGEHEMHRKFYALHRKFHTVAKFVLNLLVIVL